MILQTSDVLVVNNITVSTATTLLELPRLTLIDCKMMEEIVASKKDSNAPVEIAFMKLEKLGLENLPRFTTFKFPSLTTVSVR